MGLRDAVERRKAERQNGAGEKHRSIAALRAAKKNTPDARHSGLGALRKKHTERVKVSSKLDFNIDGMIYHGARIFNREGRPWGTVLVTNGDSTYEFHNRFGSWMHNVDGHGRMAEPAAVARAMGTSASQLEVCMALSERFHKQLKAEGIATPEERIRQREEEARKSRRGGRRKNDDA